MLSAHEYFSHFSIYCHIFIAFAFYDYTQAFAAIFFAAMMFSPPATLSRQRISLFSLRHQIFIFDVFASADAITPPFR